MSNYNEFDHPRGNPNNDGQFAKKYHNEADDFELEAPENDTINDLICMPEVQYAVTSCILTATSDDQGIGLTLPGIPDDLVARAAEKLEWQYRTNFSEDRKNLRNSRPIRERAHQLVDHDRAWGCATPETLRAIFHDSGLPADTNWLAAYSVLRTEQRDYADPFLREEETRVLPGTHAALVEAYARLGRSRYNVRLVASDYRRLKEELGEDVSEAVDFLRNADGEKAVGLAVRHVESVEQRAERERQFARRRLQEAEQHVREEKAALRQAQRDYQKANSER